MNTADYVVLGLIALLILGAVLWILHRRRQGRSSCGNCPYRDSCAYFSRSKPK